MFGWKFTKCTCNLLLKEILMYVCYARKPGYDKIPGVSMSDYIWWEQGCMCVHGMLGGKK